MLLASGPGPRPPAAYVIPKIDVLLAGTFQSSPGVPLAANYVVSSAVVAQSLGRPLSNNAPNVTINLLTPGDAFGERVNQLDFRVGRSCASAGTGRPFRPTCSTP